MTVAMIQVVNGTKVASDAATVTSTLSNAVEAGDVVVALVANNSGGDQTVAGLGATWTRAGKDALNLLDLWVGTGATTTGTVTATRVSGASGGFKYLSLWHVRGAAAGFIGGVDNATGDTLVSTAMTIGPGQIFIGSGYSDSTTDAFSNPSPTTGWVNSGALEIATGQRFASRVHRIPVSSATHQFSTFRSGSTAHPIVRLVLGVRTNLVKNPSFEVDLTGWVANPATKYAPLPELQRNTTQAFTGTSCLEATVELEGGESNLWFLRYGVSSAGAKNAEAAAITVGQTARVSHYVKATSTTSVMFYTRITFFDSGGSVIGTPVSSNYTPTTSWGRQSHSAVAPSGAAHFGFSIEQVASGLNGIYFDSFLAEVSTTLGTYFDGDTSARKLSK